MEGDFCILAIEVKPICEELENKFHRLKELQSFVESGSHPHQAGAGVAENGDRAVMGGYEQGIAQFIGFAVSLQPEALAFKGLATAETVEVLRQDDRAARFFEYGEGLLR